jgi:hypothetical protein
MVQVVIAVEPCFMRATRRFPPHGKSECESGEEQDYAWQMDWGIGVGRIVCASIHGIERRGHHHRAGDGGFEVAGREQRCRDPSGGKQCQRKRDAPHRQPWANKCAIYRQLGTQRGTRVGDTRIAFRLAKTAAVKIKTPYGILVVRG